MNTILILQTRGQRGVRMSRGQPPQPLQSQPLQAQVVLQLELEMWILDIYIIDTNSGLISLFPVPGLGPRGEDSHLLGR